MGWVYLDDLQLNVPLLRRRVPNLTIAAKSAGLRPATVSNLCTGKIPVGRAEVRTIAILASLAGCTIDELLIRGSSLGMIETGIKALDLLAPLVRGGTIGLVARPGTGQLVLLAELFHRLRGRDYATIMWIPGYDSPGVSDAVHESESACASYEEAKQLLIEARETRDVLIGVDRTMVLSGEVQMLREELKMAGARPVTFVLVDARGEAPDQEAPYGPLETLIKFDTELIARGIYPAIDPLASTSVLLEGLQLESNHQLLQQRARKLLRRYRELRPLAAAGSGWERLSEEDRMLYRQGEQLESLLTQPFYIAEPYTKTAGTWVTLHDTLARVRGIVDAGAYKEGINNGDL